MKTSQTVIIHSSGSFVKKRYAPILATFVETSVDSFANLCGFNFVDILASVGSLLPKPLRIYPFELIRQHNIEEFVDSVFNEISEIGNLFITEKYEKSFDIDEKQRNKLTFPNLMPKHFTFSNFDKKKPPWYKVFTFRLFESLFFCDFEFSDLPIALLYVTSVESEKKMPQEIREVFQAMCPTWMKEFVKDIPVLCILVNNRLKNAELFSMKHENNEYSDFKFVVGVNYLSGGEKIEQKVLKDLFGWDKDIMQSPILGNNFSKDDIHNVESALTAIYNSFVLPEVIKLQKFYEEESDRLNKFSKAIQSWLFKKEPEEVTQYMNFPIKRISYLRHAAYCMMTQNVSLAQRSYRYFLQYFGQEEIPTVKKRAEINNIISELAEPDGYRKFIDDAMQYIENEPLNPEILRTQLILPILGMEFADQHKEMDTVLKFCIYSIQYVNQLYHSYPTIKGLFKAILFERLAIIETRKRHQIAYRTLAAYSYRQCDQKGHTIRCFLWLLKKLPKKVWSRLWQTIDLEKALIISEMGQNQRAVSAYAKLLSVNNLSDDLQRLLLLQFLTTFKDKDIDFNSLSLELRPLLFVKKVKIYNHSLPEFYGYKKSDFQKMMDHYDRWFSANISRSSSVSFEDIWETSNSEISYEDERFIVAVDSELLVEILLYNCHAFTVHMNSASLGIKYEGQETSAQNQNSENNASYAITSKALENIDINGSTSSNFKLIFHIIPRLQGKYSIGSFNSNYWGYINSSVEFEPHTFAARREYPRISLTIEDLPQKVVSNQCISFALCIENKSSTSLEYRILCDPFLIYDESETEIFKHVQIISPEEPLQEMDITLKQFILHVPNKNSIDLHFIVDVHGIKVGYIKVPIEIEQNTSIEIQPLHRTNETRIQMLKCLLKSTRPIKFISVIDNNGTNLKSICNNDQTQNLIIVDLNASGNSREIIDEEWRIRLLKNNEIGFLYQTEGDEYNAQFNVDISSFINTNNDLNTEISKSRLLEKSFINTITQRDTDHMEIHKVNNEKLNFKLRIDGDKCIVSLIEYEGSKLYIEPLPIKMCMFIENNINCCSWVGKKRQLIGKDTDAVFQFVVNRPGIAKINGFNISEKKDFSLITFVNITHTFEVKL